MPNTALSQMCGHSESYSMNSSQKGKYHSYKLNFNSLLITLSGIPYPTMTNLEVLEQLKNGYRLPIPSKDTPAEVYALMKECWLEGDLKFSLTLGDICSRSRQATRLSSVASEIEDYVKECRC
jgi:hypothetical protein